MPDQVTKVTKVGFGSRLGGSFKGIFFGILLFLASFVVIYWNEGRVDVSEIANTAIEISATEQNTDAALEGQLVSMTGLLQTEDIIGDGLYLEPGNFVRVYRRVEMFAWKENSDSKTTTNLGGSQTTETTYTYTKEWSVTPQSSSSFEEVEGHTNSEKAIEDKTVTASNAIVGIYVVQPDKMQLPATTLLTLDDKIVNISTTNLISSSTPKTVREGNYIFVGEGTLSNPEVGDLRIQYEVLRPGSSVTAFGKLSGNSLVSYTDKDGTILYRALAESREDAVSTMHSEYTLWLWIFRIVGFLMMWIGLSSILAPISVLFDILPALGSISRSLVGGITFVIALILSGLAIIISMLLHSLVALIILGVVGIGAAVWFVKKKMRS
ncbi:MAG TPA: hypothetical protein DCS29_03395 [Candidatus Magasanikbacteria bacterium]|nr:hypothetical protein [Candidatus Magasanikbacteria bacterium]